jgi:hypothetical protein
LLWGRAFYVDWINHVWLVQYYADHLLRYGEFPTTVDARQAFANPMPMFYGVFFYPLVALLAVPAGADAAVRIVCAALLMAPLLSFTVLFRRLLQSTPLAVLITIALNASVYQLTNLYARSAITEFVAYQLILLCISLLFYGLHRGGSVGNAAVGLAFACGTLAIGSHPITFYTFTLFVLPVIALGAWPLRRMITTRQVNVAFLFTAAAVLVLLPWIAITLHYRADVNITSGSDLIYFPRSIDSALAKLGLFYTDARVLADGIGTTSTPFLNAPFAIASAVPLIVICASLFKSRGKGLWWIIAPTAAAFLLLIYASIPGQALLLTLLHPIQFAYRLSGTFGLIVAVATTVAAAMCAISSCAITRTSQAAIAVAVVLCVALVAHKFYLTRMTFKVYPEYKKAAKDVRQEPNDPFLLLKRADYLRIVKDVSNYPFSFAGATDYAMPKIYARSPNTLPGEVVDLMVDGWGQPARATCSERCLIRTNIVPSKFHYVLVDGLAGADLTVSNIYRIEILADAGAHSVQVEKIDGRLPKYVSASISAMLLWLLLSIAALGVRFRQP